MVLRVSVTRAPVPATSAAYSRGLGGDGAHALGQVQRNALGRQHAARQARDAHEPGARLKGGAVGNELLNHALRVLHEHGGREHVAAGEDAGFAGHQPGRCLWRGRQQRGGGDVTVGCVLRKGRAQDVSTAVAGSAGSAGGNCCM